MEIKRTKLDELKGTNPFKLPEGYLEELTEQIMSRLPEKPCEETKVISLYERIRPWLYMAGVFVGLIFLFKVFTLLQPAGENKFQEEPLYVQTTSPEPILATLMEDDSEYLEYLESDYYNNMYSEELENIE
ncbi:MAG: hypothetical protein LBT83_02665 [Tannerella sp.]|jgi:hypothetical protein|nr:hypothetical protein [Tannerella sp.]